MKVLAVVLLALGICMLPGHLGWSAAATVGGDVAFLDLPDGFGVTGEDEIEPEIIEFYTDDYEGDAFFFCLDRSWSMTLPAASGESKYAVMKREVVRALQGLTARSVVSVVFYNADLDPLTYGDPPIKMEAGAKAQLISRIVGTPSSNGSCMFRGAEKLLRIALKTQNEFRTMIIVADGRTHCSNGDNTADGVFNRIIAKNVTRMPINTIYTGPMSGEDWTIGKPLLERLARATNGKFKIAR
ncbi:MAG TPA: VWA domain-containing protein [Planctomycetota bacterium]|nr:VWA domain-containing protein [Planctomycetota bacterium]HQM61599.1 VWA domain-containing protein [Planctomycetota bacterium]